MADLPFMTKKQVLCTIHGRIRQALQELIVKYYVPGGSGRSMWPCSALVEACRAINVNVDVREMFSSIQQELLEDGWALQDPTPDWDSNGGTMTCISVAGLGDSIVRRASAILGDDDHGDDHILVLKREADGSIAMYEARSERQKKPRVDGNE